MFFLLLAFWGFLYGIFLTERSSGCLVLGDHTFLLNMRIAELSGVRKKPVNPLKAGQPASLQLTPSKYQ
jgi:hypothetical protein